MHVAEEGFSTCQEKAKESQCITIFRCYTGQLVILESYPMKLSPNLDFYHYNNINFNSLNEDVL